MANLRKYNIVMETNPPKESERKVSPRKRDVGLVSVSDQNSVTKEDTRSKIAHYYVLGFLGIIGFSLLISYRSGYQVDDITSILVAISGVLSGPLGFIIGYYYKATD
jgi:hypothetical protein